MPKKVNFFGLKLKLKFRALDNSFLSLNLCRAALRAVSGREREEGEGPSLLLTITFMHARSEVVVVVVDRCQVCKEAKLALPGRSLSAPGA